MRVIGPVFLIALCLPVLLSWAGAQSVRMFGLRAPRSPHRTDIPLPKPRPVEAGPRTTVAPVQAEAEAASEPPPPSDCFLALSAGIAEVRQMPPIVEANGCEAPDVVQLDAVLTADRRRISVVAAGLASLQYGDGHCDMGARRSSDTSGVTRRARCRVSIISIRSNAAAAIVLLARRPANTVAPTHSIFAAFIVNGGRKLELTNPEVSREFRDAMRDRAHAVISRPFWVRVRTAITKITCTSILPSGATAIGCASGTCAIRKLPLPRERPAEAGPREDASEKSP